MFKLTSIYFINYYLSLALLILSFFRPDKFVQQFHKHLEPHHMQEKHAAQKKGENLDDLGLSVHFNFWKFEDEVVNVNW